MTLTPAIRRFAAAFLLVAAAAAPSFAGGPALDPAKTFLFAVSIVKWPEAAGLDAFTDERKDGPFVAAFGAAGVSSDNITFLTDERATLAALRDGIRALASRAGEGSTLVLSFQGHGAHEGRETYYLPYDVGDDLAKTAFAFSEIAPILDACFKGDRLILLGDCCHSGALAETVRHFEKSRVKAACLTSATASNRSTGNWTFTEAVTDALRGDGRLDRDHDGAVTFGETDRWIHEVMKYREGQLTHATRTSSFEPELELHAVTRAVADVPGDYKVGDFVDAQGEGGAWCLAEVLSGGGGTYHVHYQAEEPRKDEDVAADHLRAPVAKELTIGARYEVEWDDDEWYPCTVTRVAEGWFYFVHYEGENGEDDEWIVATSARAPTKPEFRALVKHTARKGDAVAARWRTDWYLATVEAVGAKTFRVRHGDGSSARVTRQELIVVATASELAEGDRVLACRNGEVEMFPGKVAKKTATACTIQWEDGSKEEDVAVGEIARIRAD